MDYIKTIRHALGSQKIILNCAGALIIRDGRILFQRRTDNGRWGLIGGLLEMNETYQQAALREIREETGLEVRLDHFLGIFHNHNMVWSNGDAAHVISAMFTATIVSGEPRIDEESYELRFFGKEEIPELFAEDHIAALEAYFRGVRRPMLHARSLTLTRLPAVLSYLEGTAFRAPAPDDLCRVMERLGFIDPGVRP